MPAGPPRNVAALYLELARAIADNRPVTPDFAAAVGYHELLSTLQRASDTGVRQDIAADEHPWADEPSRRLPIVDCGDPVLRQPAEPVDPADLRAPELQRLVALMRATMEAAPGVGLAAPQVGVALQLAVLQDGPDRWGQLSEESERRGNATPCPSLS